MKKTLISLCLVFAVMLSFHVAQVQAETVPVTGWAWSSNIGWLSFSSTNPGATTSSLPTPVARYTFDADTAADTSGNARNGTLVNSPTFTSGVAGGRALNLDGVNDYVGLPASIALTGPTSITLTAWIKPNDVAREQRIINYHGRYRLELSNTGRVYCAFSTVGKSWDFCNSTSNTNLTINTWHHVAVTYDALTSTYTYYRNGVVDGSSTLAKNGTSPIPFSGSLSGGQYMPCIGYGCDESGKYSGGVFSGSLVNAFNGAIDDARIYNRALTAAQMWELYQTSSLSGPISYGVKFSTTTGSMRGNLDGEAWSPNVGWVSFRSDDVANCPKDSSPEALDGCNPAVDISTGSVSNSGKVTGWARILSMKNEDGEGWLQLSGTNHASPNTSGYLGTSTQGVTYDPKIGAFSGFAWESSALGWVNFMSMGTSTGVCVYNCGGGPTQPPQNIVGECRINGAIPPQTVNSNTTLTFRVEGVSGGTGSYSYSFNPLGGGNSSTVAGSSNFYNFGYPSTERDTTYNPSVKVTGSTAGEGVISCPTVTVKGDYVDNGLKLMILREDDTTRPTDDYSDNPNGADKKLTVRKGQKFKLQWNINSSVGNRFFDLKVSPSGSPWSTYNPLITSSSISGDLSTATSTAGTYVFQLRSADNVIGPYNIGSFVTLIVTDSSLEEI